MSMMTHKANRGFSRRLPVPFLFSPTNVEYSRGRKRGESQKKGSCEFMVEKITDYELIRLISDRDRSAFETLYDRHSTMVYRFALRFVRKPEAAEEIVQDVFFKIWNKASSYHPQSSQVTTWMLSICRHACIDALRKQKNQPQAVEPDPAYELPDTETDVEEQVEWKEKQKQVHQALHSLPAEQRQVVEWMYFQGLTQSEIARQYSIPVGTIKSRVRLAMNKLKRAWKAFERRESDGDQ